MTVGRHHEGFDAATFRVGTSGIAVDEDPGVEHLLVR